jgi:cell wall assembly regulator SMI1
MNITDSSQQLTERQIDEAERGLGRSIPPDYRKFLLQYNGGRPVPSDFVMAGPRKGSTQIGTVRYFLGIGTPEETENLDYVLGVFSDRMPPRIFPIARDPGGNFICISNEGADTGTVYFWDHERESEEGEAPGEQNLFIIANSFDEFLEKLTKS